MQVYLGLDDRGAPGHRRQRVEVLPGVPVPQVALGVGRVRVHEADAGDATARSSTQCLPSNSAVGLPSAAGVPNPVGVQVAQMLAPPALSRSASKS